MYILFFLKIKIPPLIVKTGKRNCSPAHMPGLRQLPGPQEFSAGKTLVQAFLSRDHRVRKSAGGSGFLQNTSPSLIMANKTNPEKIISCLP